LEFFFYKIALFIDKLTKSFLIFYLLIFHNYFNQLVPQIYTDFDKFSKTFDFFLENNDFFSECLFLFQFLTVKNPKEIAIRAF